MSGISSFTDVPVVDVAGLRSPDPGRQSRVVEELGRAGREVGFCYITGTGMAPELFEALLAATKRSASKIGRAHG